MATHKSALKAHRRSVKNAERNISIKSRVKTFFKKTEALIADGDAEAARKSLSQADSEMMKAVSKGVYKLNTAARYVSKLAKRVKAAATKA